MGYAELEKEVYSLMRQTRLTEAKLTVQRGLKSLTAAETPHGLYLYANVMAFCSPTALAESMQLVQRVLDSDGVSDAIRLKTHLLGAVISRLAGWREQWVYHLRDLDALVQAHPTWWGRVARVWAQYLEETGDVRGAIIILERVVEWYETHTGLYDQRDDDCHKAATLSDLSRLYLLAERHPDAAGALDRADQTMPANVGQRVYIHLGRARCAVAVGDWSSVATALDKAEAFLREYPHPEADAELNRLRALCLIESGRHDEANVLTRKLINLAVSVRNVRTLLQLEPMLVYW